MQSMVCGVKLVSCTQNGLLKTVDRELAIIDISQMVVDGVVAIEENNEQR